MKYIYQRDGGPLLRWANSAPRQTRAADATALGSLGGHTLGGHTLKEPTIGGSLQSGPPGPLSVGALELPVPGGPEPVSFGACACKGGVGGIAETIGGLSMPMKIAGAVGLYFLYKKLKKKR